MKKKPFPMIFIIALLLALFSLVKEVSASNYYASGNMTSTNLLSGQTVTSIDSFDYYASSIPAGTGLKVQFSQDGSTWKNSAGTTNGWDTLSQGASSVDLSSLSWSGANFYYKMQFTSDASNTPVLDNITVTYTSNLPPTLNQTIPDINIYEDMNSTNKLNLTQYFTDPDNDALFYNYTPKPVANIWIGIDQAMGLAHFHPDMGFTGTRTVNFSAKDPSGENVSSNQVTINVNAVAPPPDPSASVNGSNINFQWSSSGGCDHYEVHCLDSLSSGSWSACTGGDNIGSTSWEDTSAGNYTKRFYKVVCRTEDGTLKDTNMFHGKQDYSLTYNTNPALTSKNWITLPLNSTFTAASELLLDINATAVSWYNASSQTEHGCLAASWPSLCNDPVENFTLAPGYSYEVTINSAISWTLTGTVSSNVELSLEKPTGKTGLNRIALPTNTSISNAQGLISSISTADVVTRFDPTTQHSVGYIKLTPSKFIGVNFNTDASEGYEVSVTSDTNWQQE